MTKAEVEVSSTSYYERSGHPGKLMKSRKCAGVTFPAVHGKTYYLTSMRVASRSRSQNIN